MARPDQPCSGCPQRPWRRIHLGLLLLHNTTTGRQRRAFLRLLLLSRDAAMEAPQGAPLFPGPPPLSTLSAPTLPPTPTPWSSARLRTRKHLIAKFLADVSSQGKLTRHLTN
ncbi:hypothetical protein ACQJBY_045264 [Aegilops geniculata]